ncbi:hypothetical protein D3C85_1677680 [compost metagenome]
MHQDRDQPASACAELMGLGSLPFDGQAQRRFPDGGVNDESDPCSHGKSQSHPRISQPWMGAEGGQRCPVDDGIQDRAGQNEHDRYI